MENFQVDKYCDSKAAGSCSFLRCSCILAHWTESPLRFQEALWKHVTKERSFFMVQFIGLIIENYSKGMEEKVMVCLITEWRFWKRLTVGKACSERPPEGPEFSRSSQPNGFSEDKSLPDTDISFLLLVAFHTTHTLIQGWTSLLLPYLELSCELDTSDEKTTNLLTILQAGVRLSGLDRSLHPGLWRWEWRERTKHWVSQARAFVWLFHYLSDLGQCPAAHMKAEIFLLRVIKVHWDHWI